MMKKKMKLKGIIAIALSLVMMTALTACSILEGPPTSELVPTGYVSKDEHLDTRAFGDYTDYAEYQYDDNAIISESGEFSLVNAESIERLSAYFDNFADWVKYREKESQEEWYSFDYGNQLKENDYYILNVFDSEPGMEFHMYEILYYDMDNSRLYYFNVST